MKPSLILSAALFSFSAPALAETPTEQPFDHQFEHEGITYMYNVAPAGEGRVPTGRHYPSGARFRLTVRDGRVTGRMNGSAVRFQLSSVEDGTSQDMALASRQKRRTQKTGQVAFEHSRCGLPSLFKAWPVLGWPNQSA